MPTVLTDETVIDALHRLPGWVLEEGVIVKEYKLASFRAAIAFINCVADRADAADHHPELRNTYDRVRVALRTHSAGGVTEKDLALAAEIEACSAAGA